MNSFFRTWLAMNENGIDDTAAIKAFLSCSPESSTFIHYSDKVELDAAFKVLRNSSIDVFLDVLKEMDVPLRLQTGDIPCYSNFAHGAHRLNEILEFKPCGMCFADIGSMLMHSSKPGAKIKYGENHSKLAAMMGLVKINDGMPQKVVRTALGSYLTAYEYDDKIDILKKLLLRDVCVRTFVCTALLGKVCYKDLTGMLSRSTRVRRKANTKFLVEFVLNGSKYEKSKFNIDWSVD